MTGYKILTHDWRSPLQGGEPVCAGTLPWVLPRVQLDTSASECGAGWNFCQSLSTAAKIAGFWPTGRPTRCLVVEAPSSAIERGNKCRAAELTLVRLCTETEIKSAMRELVASWAGAGNIEPLVREQYAWYTALGRPTHDRRRVIEGLRGALSSRGLSWKLKEYPDARAAWAAWDAWDAWDARAAWDAWDARAAWDAWAAWDARAARAAWAAWAAWDAWAARAAWAAWDAGAARAALSLYSAVSVGWLVNYKKDRLTKGLRSAYYNGLDAAVPVGSNTLGWSLARESCI